MGVLKMDISLLKINQKAKIVSINGKGVLRHRLLEMGLTPNTMITLVKIAPFGDPIEITVRGYELTLRKEDAKLIEVEVIE